MRVLICPDSFTGTLSAAEAAQAISDGWALVSPTDDLVLRPLSDGGPGFLDALGAGRGGTRWTRTVTGPLGAPVEADLLTTDDGTTWIESAQAAGLHLIPPPLRDPTRTTSRGVGELIAAALADGARRIVIGVGGTGTSDGGAGMLMALGAVAEPAGSLDRGGAPLAGATGLELGPALATLRGCALEVATDVDVPLLGPRGAARGFAPQKGASPEQVEQLEVAMAHWATLLGRSADGRSAAVALGAGAGGGLGAALIRLGARRVPGLGTVLGAADLDELLPGMDLVITGEGSFDWQSLRGKVVAGVAQVALTHAVPVLVLAGRVEVGRREWVAAGVAGAFAGAAEPGEAPRDGVVRAAARVARTWSRR